VHQPVRYDPRAFDAAIAEADAAIQRLDERMDDRLQRLREQLPDWQGGLATSFRSTYQQRLIAVHQRTLAELEATRSHLLFARDLIEQENTRRTLMREWGVA
jgi:uncharacterized protein YukE